MTALQDLPLADLDHDWDGDAAEKRVRRWAGAEEGPNDSYRDAHGWHDAENKQNFTAYELLIADVVDGRLTVVPRGLTTAGTRSTAVAHRARIVPIIPRSSWSSTWQW